MLIPDLSRPLNFNLKKNVSPVGWRRERRAVEIAVELGPLVETAGVDQSFELVALNEDILVTLLTRALDRKSTRLNSSHT